MYISSLPSPPDSPAPAPCCTAPEDRLGLILADRLELTSVLGTGAYGVVYTAVDIYTNTPYAVKALNKAGLDSRQQKFQQREIELHYQASGHPNIVSLLRITDGPDCTFVILEYCPEGDLFSTITEKGPFNWDFFLAKNLFLQILDAVEYLHSIGIYHRDLKPENILVTDNGTTLKIADFGLATTEAITHDFGCGSTFYMSPECIQNSRYGYCSAPSDVWSLGVILVNLTCGRNPWKKAASEDSTFNAYRHDSNYLASILPISPELNSILQRIFEIDPSKRVTLPELRQLIVECPQFTVESSATASSTSMPGQFTPPTSTIQLQAVPEVMAYDISTEPQEQSPAQLEQSPPAYSHEASPTVSCAASVGLSDFGYCKKFFEPSGYLVQPMFNNFWNSLMPLAETTEKITGHHHAIDHLFSFY
ncbi:hypothetical protein KEM56_001584 [Ascosphaera pollenicola]|nr:hypothetical protein KEM56_001584 [Ascosphaera pollenicola]